MGCDIHIYFEKQLPDGRWESVDVPNVDCGGYMDKPLSWRGYGMFAFLAGVRNYSDITPIAEPRGLPDDIAPTTQLEWDNEYGDGHTPSWLLLRELTDFNYDQAIEDRRITVKTEYGSNGGCTAPPGGGRTTTYREFLGDNFANALLYIKLYGVTRLVFWFDN